MRWTALFLGVCVGLVYLMHQAAGLRPNLGGMAAFGLVALGGAGAWAYTAWKAWVAFRSEGYPWRALVLLVAGLLVVSALMELESRDVTAFLSAVLGLVGALVVALAVGTLGGSADGPPES